jgi:hypothetical protein
MDKIYVIRGRKVLLDSDLAALYEAETRQLKDQFGKTTRGGHATTAHNIPYMPPGLSGLFVICKYLFYAPNQSHLPVVWLPGFHR